MRQDFFDFVPTFKLFIVGNHKPRLSSVDEAMRRRLLLVPFTVQIPPAERDPELPRKLGAEWPAILRWCIDGCIEWQRVGLAPPAIVRDATDAYFADHDTLQQWLDDCTHDAAQAVFTRTAALFSSWKLWCEDRNLKSGSANVLSEALGPGLQKGTGRWYRPAVLLRYCHQAEVGCDTRDALSLYYPYDARARNGDNERPCHVCHKLLQLAGPRRIRGPR
jgi:phage/plasmid-associated DNA primase